MLRTTAIICLILLILAATAAAVPVQLTRSPNAPIKVDNNNARYFTYGGKTVLLIGMSGEFLPQMDWVKTGAPAVFAEDNCGAQKFQNTQVKKYVKCIDKLAELNLNVMRIWVGMNHSPGRKYGADPFTFEQPYKWDTASQKWKMDVFDDTYDKSLYDVIEYAQRNGVIVEVTLFDPFTFGNQSKTPWRKDNHTMGQTILPTGDPCRSTTNSEFVDYLQQFVKSEKTTPFLIGTNNTDFPSKDFLNDRAYRIDTDCQNVKTRAYQVALAKHLVELLNGKTYTGDAKYGKRLYNFYWELANEPDGNSSTWQQSLNWHYYMAWQLREYEKSLFPTSYHLISANLALQKLFDDVLPRQSVKSYIDIAEAHYVKKGTVDPEPTPTPRPIAANYTNGVPEEEGPVLAPYGEEPIFAPGGEEPGVSGEEGTFGTTGGGETTTGGMTIGGAAATTVSELGAMEMVRKYNVDGGAANASKNTKIWGFNETHITGLGDVTAASVRAEAWEFMLAGGAIYDNMGFKWGNLDNNLNSNVTKYALDDLSRLYGIIGDSAIDLKTMKRTVINGPIPWADAMPNGWIRDLPLYGSAPTPGGVNRYYALMRNNDYFFYYRHNSRYTGSANDNNARYSPVITNGGYNDTIKFKNPFDCAATFTYQWIRPKSAHPESTTAGALRRKRRNQLL